MSEPIHIINPSKIEERYKHIDLLSRSIDSVNNSPRNTDERMSAIVMCDKIISVCISNKSISETALFSIREWLCEMPETTASRKRQEEEKIIKVSLDKDDVPRICDFICSHDYDGKIIDYVLFSAITQNKPAITSCLINKVPKNRLKVALEKSVACLNEPNLTMDIILSVIMKEVYNKRVEMKYAHAILSASVRKARENSKHDVVRAMIQTIMSLMELASKELKGNPDATKKRDNSEEEDDEISKIKKPVQITNRKYKKRKITTNTQEELIYKGITVILKTTLLSELGRTVITVLIDTFDYDETSEINLNDLMDNINDVMRRKKLKSIHSKTLVTCAIRAIFGDDAMGISSEEKLICARLSLK